MFRFGGVAVDPRAREVTRDGRAQHLEPQAFDLLVHLIERREEVVAKHDLLDGVWGHRFVSEAALTTRVKEIRRAVGDDGATQHTIRNVRGRGYRFVAELDTDGTTAPRPAQAPRSLVGREHELADVAGRFAHAPVVTLVGPGGVGKSTLARAVAGSLAAHHRDGVRFVDLAPLERGDQVVPALARDFDVVLDPTCPERALAPIARLDVLLVLDNCEHVIDDVAVAAERMLATPGAAVRILATSQVRLGLGDEQVVGLAPLAPNDAVALFTTRAQAIDPSWDVGDHGGDGRIAALVDQLDRLPLTIEMAASRLASMTFDELEAAVAEGTRLVQLTHRTPTRRHRTLASLVEWSADLLAPEHRAVFVDFSVFAGAVTAADAAAVLGPGRSGAVAELVDRSLLAVDLGGSSARYRMLDTVRTVAVGWLRERDDAGVVHLRHAAAVADWTERIDEALRGVDESSGRRRLADITDELRHAHRWAREHDVELAERLDGLLHLPAYNRLWAEPAMWARELLDSAAGDPLLPAARVLSAGAAVNAGDLDAARREGERVVAAADVPLHVLGAAHDVLSDVALYGGRHDDVEVHTTAMLAIADELGDTHLRVLATINRSVLLTFNGSAADGLALLDTLDRAPMSRSSQAWVAYAAGEAHVVRGESDRAIDEFGRAIDLGASVDNPFVTSVARSALAAELARSGAARAAYEAYRSGLRSALRHGNLVHATTMVRNLVALLHADGDHRSAVVLATATGPNPLLDEIESATWPDRFGSWVAEGEALDLDATVRRAIAIVESHLGQR
jgi:predicted ATPase/DNA-binding winged helix-turn-helix (wHTH) protein